MADSLLKKCSTCKEEKSVSAFSRDRRAPNGYASCCKECLREKRKIFFAKNPERKKKHYFTMKNKEKVVVLTQTCTKCKQTKTAKFFGTLCVGKNGLHPQCKQCRNNYNNSRYWGSEAVRKSAIKQSTISNRKRKYGVSAERYNQIFESQNGECAICEDRLDDSSFSLRGQLDHDHKTGLIRGILCGKCNTALGLLKEDLEIFYKAISYLSKEKQVKNG